MQKISAEEVCTDDSNKINRRVSLDLHTHFVDAHPECSVCLQPCLHPVKLPCSHIFCFLCVKGFAYRSRRCALCRREVSLEYFEKPVVVKVRQKQDEDSGNPESPCHSKESYNWFYEGRNGWWQYDERASSILEEAFKSESRSCDLIIAGFLYLVDFSNMIQFRKTNPARCRRVKRDKVNADKKGIAGLKLKTRPTKQICSCVTEKTTKNCSKCSQTVCSNRLSSPDNKAEDSTDVVNTETVQQTEAESIAEEIQTRMSRLMSDPGQDS